MHIEIRMFRSFNFLGRKCLYQNQQNLQNGDILKIDSSPTISQTSLILRHLIIQNAVATFFLPKVCFCNCDLVSGMKTSSESSERHLQSPQFKTNIYIHSPCRQHYKKYTVPTNLWEQPIGNHHLLFPQSLWEQLVPQICRNNQQGTNFLFPQSLWDQRCSHKGAELNLEFFKIFNWDIEGRGQGC